MRHEYRQGSLHASHVRSAFLRALRKHLPDAAFAELDAMPMERETIEGWAAAHGINAPCVVEEFAYFCDGGWSKYRHVETDSWAGPEIPREWLQLVGEWNNRLIDRWAWRDDHADEFLLAEAGRNRLAPGIAPDTITAALNRHLGPIATDPSRESWEDFQVRARHHWIARVHAAKKFGFRPAGKESEWRNLDRDIQWLLRHQVGREPYDKIAGPPEQDGTVDPDVVK